MNIASTIWAGMLPLAASVLVAVTCAACKPQTETPMTQAARQNKIDSLYEGYRNDFPNVVDVTPQELARLWESGNVVIVDVREAREQAVSRIPGAITKEEFEAHLDDYKGKTVVAHCTIGYRSGVYAKELKARGIDAKNLAGSILSWVNAGQPVIDAEGKETRRVHVYGRTWNILPEGYEPVW
jgi:sodium/bile acid cotransporter 7